MEFRLSERQATAGSAWAWGDTGSSYGGYLGDGTNGPPWGSDGTIFIRSDASGNRSLWGTAWHYSNMLVSGGAGFSRVPIPLASGSFIAAAIGRTAVALRSDTTLLVWRNGNRNGDGYALGTQSAGGTDPDGDGLTTAQELALGSDPFNPDTNGDGIRDGVALASGLSLTNPDMDGDGLGNAVELAIGTDPFVADTDGDGHLDGADAFPLDPTRWQAPAPTPGDTTPPTITLTEPANAVLVP